MKLVTLVDIIS